MLTTLWTITGVIMAISALNMDSPVILISAVIALGIATISVKMPKPAKAPAPTVIIDA